MRHLLGLARAIGILTGGMGPGAGRRALVIGPGTPDSLTPGLLAAPVEAISVSSVAGAADPHQPATSSA